MGTHWLFYCEVGAVSLLVVVVWEEDIDKKSVFECLKCMQIMLVRPQSVNQTVRLGSKGYFLFVEDSRGGS
jgi:hypothetical protein